MARSSNYEKKAIEYIEKAESRAGGSMLTDKWTRIANTYAILALVAQRREMR